MQRCYDREALYEFLHAADGNFSAVVRSGGRLVLVADRMRTYPLLYAVRDGAVTVTSLRAMRNAYVVFLQIYFSSSSPEI